MNGTAQDYQLKPFLQPESVAVIGSTERPGSWGAHIMISMKPESGFITV